MVRPRTLLEQLAELDRPAPADFDPEDVGYEETLAKPSYAASDDGEVEIQPARLRKERNHFLDDPAYKGKRSSRQAMGFDTLGVVHAGHFLCA